MGTTQTLRSRTEINRLKQYFIQKGQIRNYVMITMGLNTSIRISDLLNLTWEDVYLFPMNQYREYISLFEKTTEKHTLIPLNKEVIKALDNLRAKEKINATDYIFKSRVGKNRPIGRTQAFRIIKQASEELNLEGIISCHSLRKTFGYQAWKQGLPLAVIMEIYNHSALEIIKRRLSIAQDEKDEVFMALNL